MEPYRAQNAAWPAEGLSAERPRSMARVVTWVAEQGPPRAQFTVAGTTDIRLAMTNAEMHQLLTIDRQWSRE